jgi:hypothetical protein
VIGSEPNEPADGQAIDGERGHCSWRDNQMRDDITIETDWFEHREVKPDFINPCCFGQDFASWLRGELMPLTANGFLFAKPVQEDYGWGFWATHQKGRFWIALSYVGDGPQEEPAHLPL